MGCIPVISEKEAFVYRQIFNGTIFEQYPLEDVVIVLRGWKGMLPFLANITDEEIELRKSRMR